MKKNQINYKSLLKYKLKFIKSYQLKKKKIYTIVLDELSYGFIENKYYELNNVENIIIDYETILKRPFGTLEPVSIRNTKVDKIYFENQSNLGGLTIPVNYLIDKLQKSIIIFWNSYKDKCNIKEINIISPKGIKTLNLNKDIKRIEIQPITYEDKEKFIRLSVESEKYEVLYDIFIENICEKYKKYTFTDSDVEDGILDLRNINDINEVYCEDLYAETILINKEDLFGKFADKFGERIKVNKIKVIDNNEMKLNPEIEIIMGDIIDTYDDFIVNRKQTKFIYLDNNDNIRVIDKEKMLEDEQIENVKFIATNDCELIAIKYKNGNYKIIDKYGEYLIDDLFNDFLYLNVHSYDFYKKEIPLLKLHITKNDWYKPFEDNILDNNIFSCIYDDYLKFIERIKKLKDMGFKNNAIKYLISKKYDNFINTKSPNVMELEDINENEITLFNELGEKEFYELKHLKKLKK